MGNVKFLISHSTEELQGHLTKEFVYNHKEVAKRIVLELRRKLGKFLEEVVKTFIIEYPYIEGEWRELYSLHYSKTNYDKTTPFVYRIHFFDKYIENLEDIQDNDPSYLGYVTIRPLPVSFISKIILKQYRKFYNLPENQHLYMITVEYEVHIGSKSIKFEAFPFFSQDSVISVCAHADAIMVAEIMHRRHKMSKISIEKFISKIPYSDRGREIPSGGLTVEHIASALMENGCPVKMYMRKDEGDGILKILEPYIESGLPCILGFRNHVIVIAGHTISMDENGESKFGYIIFDDSGHHIKTTFFDVQNAEEPESASPLFSIIVPKEKLQQKLTSWGSGGVVLICPIFERFYFPFESAENLANEVINSASTKNHIVARMILTDSRNLHKFLEHELGNNDYKNISFPHYVWYVEFYSKIRGRKEKLEGIMIIDASAHRDDKTYSVIKTHNNKTVCMPKNKRVYSVLTKF